MYYLVSSVCLGVGGCDHDALIQSIFCWFLLELRDSLYSLVQFLVYFSGSLIKHPPMACAGGSDRDATDDGGVFFNYRRLGMDVFFEPRRHRASKFVMHANVPGHYDFGVYAKCNFACEIREASAAAAASGPRVDPRADALLRSCIDAQPVAASSDEGDSFDTIADTLSSAWDSNSSDDPDSSDTTPAETGVKSKSRLRAVVHAASSYAPTMLVTPETKWSAVLRQFKLAKPVTMQPPPAPNTVNPFGATHLYNDGPFVFEVVPATGKIATVTLFGPSTGD